MSNNINLTYSDAKFDYKTGRNFLETFSKFFQIRDDFCNLWDVRYAVNKSYCEDLTEGKFSWVIIQGILIGKYLLYYTRQTWCPQRWYLLNA